MAKTPAEKRYDAALKALEALFEDNEVSEEERKNGLLQLHGKVSEMLANLGVSLDEDSWDDDDDEEDDWGDDDDWDEDAEEDGDEDEDFAEELGE